MKIFDQLGREIPDNTPVHIPPHLARGISRHEEMKAYIRSELSRLAAEEGEETFEEADDFDVDEDPEPFSQYEIQDAAPEWPGGIKDADADPPLAPGSTNAASGLQTAPKGTSDADPDSLGSDGSGDRAGADAPAASPPGKPVHKRGAERS